MQIKKIKEINKVNEFIKNSGFSVSYCPKVVTRQDGSALVNNNPRAGKYCGIWYTRRKILTASAAMMWKPEYIVCETESEVWEIYNKRFQETYRKLIEDNNKNFS